MGIDELVAGTTYRDIEADTVCRYVRPLDEAERAAHTRLWPMADDYVPDIMVIEDEYGEVPVVAANLYPVE